MAKAVAKWLDGVILVDGSIPLDSDWDAGLAAGRKISVGRIAVGDGTSADPAIQIGDGGLWVDSMFPWIALGVDELPGILVGRTTGLDPDYGYAVVPNLVVNQSFEITFSDLIANLNADLLDGEEGSHYLALGNATGTLAVGNGGTGQTSYTNGQLLIGNSTGNTLSKATLTGTTNQVTVTNGAGSITLSTPQDLHTSATPQFASVIVPTQETGGAIRTGLRIGDYGRISETKGAKSSIFGNSIWASNLTNNKVQKSSSDPGHFIRIRYDQGVSIHTGITGTAGTEYDETVNQRLHISGNGQVGVGTSASSDCVLRISGTIEQLRTQYNSANYCSFTVGSTGNTTLATTGTNPDIILDPGGTGKVLAKARIALDTSETFSNPGVGSGLMLYNSSNGLILYGNGSVYDLLLVNKNGNTILGADTGVAGLFTPGIRINTNTSYSNPSSDGRIHYNSTLGLMLRSSGSEGAVLITTSSGGTLLYAKNDGTVGIGATGSARLNVQKNDAGQIAYFGGANAGTRGVKIANTTTSGSSLITLAETDSTSGATPFYVIRYGSTHATKARAVELVQAENADLSLFTNFTERVTISGSGLTTFTRTSEQARFAYDASNYCSVTVSSTGTTTIGTVGTNATLLLKSIGTGKIAFQSPTNQIDAVEFRNASGSTAAIIDTINSRFLVGIPGTPAATLHSRSVTEQLRLGYDSSNYCSMTVGSTGSATIQPTGTNPDLILSSSGTGSLKLQNAGTDFLVLDSSVVPVATVYGVIVAETTLTTQFRISRGSSSAQCNFSLSAVGGHLTITPTESDADIRLRPQGTGRVNFGSHSAIGSETVTGYIEIKDAAGNVRKLAVVS